MQIITISGNLGRDAEYKETAGSDQICSFSVGVKQGWGEKASTNWFRCNVWGKRAKSLAPMLFKGMRVDLVGELIIGEYNGKPQYDVRVLSDVGFTPRERAAGTQGGGWGDDNQSSSGKAGDLDDSVPF